MAWDIKKRAIYWDNEIGRGTYQPFKNYSFKVPFELQEPDFRQGVRLGINWFNITLTEKGDPTKRECLFLEFKAPDGYKVERRYYIQSAYLGMTDIWVDVTDFGKYLVAKGHTYFIMTFRPETSKPVSTTYFIFVRVDLGVNI